MSAMSTKAQDLVDRDLLAARALAEAADKEQGEAEAEVAYAEAARGLEQFASDLWARESYSLDDVQALAIVAGALGLTWTKAASSSGSRRRHLSRSELSRI
ncbi:hypothetical protein [Thiocapsa sp. UBA6158]|uniref:hypothetical protein n=1 Tax=Thiocapsa sp. UBA6158 TaxID=1947692 RepID=UPI0025F9B6F9|nr:hypothetical protein [Thiocapsa sp. UBA6158]